jgi:uncharacterized protein
MTIQFEWDPQKGLSNLKKHKVSFDEARTVFFDEEAIVYFDKDHSDHEDRFLILGQSETTNILVVCHCHYEDPNTFRLISARRATEKENDYYFSRRTK